MRKFFIPGIFSFLLLNSCAVFRSDTPSPKTEFRGVWIATVANIDWPEKGSDTDEKKKEDFLKLLNFYRSLHFNAAIVQIRTAGDAFYPTSLAPWSRYLTGNEGQAPDGNFDYLEWMIEQTHAMGMEFHAWMNPYRATVTLDTTQLSSDHDFYRFREYMIPYGTRFYYNPGQPEVVNHLTEIVDEVVRKYNVDAIHFEDYFYPYKIEGEVFDDSSAYKQYSLPDQDIGDWRRANVDTLIKSIHQAIKKTKSHVHFGISPFGVWRNDDRDPLGSATKAGQTTYDDLYADPLNWMRNNWIDYIVPQLYFSRTYEPASFEVLLEWWSQNSPNTLLYIGHGPYKIRNNHDSRWNDKNEIPNQIKLTRKNPNVAGQIFFSARSLIGKHEDVVSILNSKIYPFLSLPPASVPFLHDHPSSFSVRGFQVMEDTLFFHLNLPEDTDISTWLIYSSKNNLLINNSEPSHLITVIQSASHRPESIGISIDKIKGRKQLGISFTDKFRKESPMRIIQLPPFIR